MANERQMTREDLERLDRYGHKRLDCLNLAESEEYDALLLKQHKDVRNHIQELRKGKG